MKVTIVGTGYVGLTTGVALAYLGNKVTCLDIDQSKIEKLKKGESPIYEPWLQELIGLSKENLTFTSNPRDSIPSAEMVFITVGTPTHPDGNPDLSHVKKAAEIIGENLENNFTVIVNKSTVPIGSGNWVKSIVQDALRSKGFNESAVGKFAIVSNPEFLREGSALHDTFYPDRIVVGVDQTQALDVLRTLYKPLLEQTFKTPPFLSRPEGFKSSTFISTDLATSELIKYAANAFLALKISFINEISHLSEKVGADIKVIAKGIGQDTRIGNRFLHAGIGWGGSCFGKDTAAIITTAHEYGISMPIIKATREVNFFQRGRVIEKLLNKLKILKGKTIGLLGLSYKPNTDDLRDAPSLDIANRLLEQGAKVRVHDPAAMPRAQKEFPNLEVGYFQTPEELAKESDALILVTEWPAYREIDWEIIAKLMRKPLIIDGRNYLDRDYLTQIGFTYLGMGR